MHLISVVSSDGRAKTATNVSHSLGANAERATNLSAADATPDGLGASATVRSARRVRFGDTVQGGASPRGPGLG